MGLQICITSLICLLGYNILYWRRILVQGNFLLKQNPSEANLTLSDLREMLPSHSHDSLILYQNLCVMQKVFQEQMHTGIMLKMI